MKGISMKEMINRLMRWLKNHGMTAEEINDCIDFITKKS